MVIERESDRRGEGGGGGGYREGGTMHVPPMGMGLFFFFLGGVGRGGLDSEEVDGMTE
jgi:hypothetical protein